MYVKAPVLLLVFLSATSLANAAGETPKTSTLIVPGKSIGGIALGADAKSDRALKALGKPDGNDTAMGGKEAMEWYLGTQRGDKGRPFHRPGEIGVNTLKNVDEDSAAHPAPEVIVKIYTTSSRFHTAEGVAPGSTLEAIRKRFPRIEPDGTNDVESIYFDPESTYWPCYGRMKYYIDVKQGIVFSIRDSDGECVEIDVVPPGTKWTHHSAPLAAGDYEVDDFELNVGDIQLGMTAPRLLVLLGQPDEKDETDYPGDRVWRWRVPAQRKDEPPGLNIYLWKLPDGSLIADQIEMTSRAFVYLDTIHPGSPLKDIMANSRYISKLTSHKIEAVDVHRSTSRKVVMMPQPKNQKNDAVDVYGDFENGLLFDVRKSDSICTSISILPPSQDIHENLSVP